MCRDRRRALGRTQASLAAAVGVTRAYISAVERRRANPTLDVAERIGAALGLELGLHADASVVFGDRRVRDVVHARMSAHVDRRLTAGGWSTDREVEIAGRRSIGWIDLVAFDTATRTLLVIELKTRLDDLGSIERQLGWYTRSARDTVRVRGWSPRRVIPWLLVLASAECDARLRTDADLAGLAFPNRAASMGALVATPGVDWPGGRGVAMVDPGSRRRDWLIRIGLDGRRGRLPYLDYADAARRLSARR